MTYEELADIFARAHEDLGSIAAALQAVDEFRARRTESNSDFMPVLEASAVRFGVPARRVLEKDRHRDVVGARFLVMKILSLRGWSTTQIGLALNLDHSTIVHGRRQVNRRPHLMSALHDVLATLQQNERTRKDGLQKNVRQRLAPRSGPRRPSRDGHDRVGRSGQDPEQ